MASRQLTSNLKRLGTFIFCVLTWGSGLTQQVPPSGCPSGAACPAASEVHKGQTKVDPQYEVIATGLLGSPVVPFQFKSASLRLEIRNLVMGNPSAETAPMPARTIFEVRGGTLIVTLNGEQRTYLSGDFFVADKGTMLKLRNPGDVVVIRTIHILENKK